MRLSSSQFPDKDSVGTSDSGSNGKCIFGTIFGAGPALHTGIPIDNYGPLTFHGKNGMWANDDAHGATVAFGLVIFKSHDIGKIS